MEDLPRSRQLFPSRASSGTAQLQFHRAKPSSLVGVIPWTLHKPGHLPSPLGDFSGNLLKLLSFEMGGITQNVGGAWCQLSFICCRVSEHHACFCTFIPCSVATELCIHPAHQRVCSSTHQLMGT